jgi:hypothetical protein
MKEAFVAAPALGLTVVEINAALPADIDSAFETMQRERCDGLLVLADPRVVARIPELAARDRLPVIYQVGLFVRRGGLMSYGPDYIDLFRRAARRGRRRRDDHGEKCRSKNLGHWVAPLALSSIEEKLNDSIATSWLEITKSYPMCPQEERSLLEARH